MMLELIGGEMKPAPDWALSVAELEQLGLDERSARLAVGVSPGFDLDGRWVVLIDDQPYDPSSAWVIDIRGGEATCSRGNNASVQRLRKRAIIGFPARKPGLMEERFVLSSAPAVDYLYGMLYSGVDLPEGDPGPMWRADDVEGLPMADAVWLYREETMRAQP